MGKKKTINEEEKPLIFPLLALERFVLTPMVPQPVKIDSEEQRDFINNISGNAQIFIGISEKGPESNE